MANDIVNINVSETTETVAITVNPNLTTVNINRQVPVGVNGQDLQSVTDIGATTTNGITIDTEYTYEIGLYAISNGIGIKGESRETYGVYGSSISATGVYGTSDNGYGVQGNSDNGVAVYGGSQSQIGVQGNSVLGTAISAYSEYGVGLYVGSESNVGVSAYSNAIGLEVNGNGTIAIEANLGNSNKGLVINSGTSSTGNPIVIDKNGVEKLSVNQAGELTATKLIKQGGTSAQLLAADGSVITAGTNVTISGGTISSTGGGGGGGATNLSPSQTANNFTINSDTGTDATIPLGNGVLAGATLNDYTTAEKSKLAGITGTNTGDQNLQQVTNLGATTTNPLTVTVPDNDAVALSVNALGTTSIGITSNADFIGVQGISTDGAAVEGNSTSGVGVVGSSTSGSGIIGSSTSGLGVYASSVSGKGIQVYGNGTVSIEANLGNSNKGLVINSGASSTGNFIELDKNGVDKLIVNQQGELTATKLIKEGGTSSQFLMADGSVTTNGGSFVPYTGAISDVNLGEFGIQLGNLEFDNTPTTIPTTAGSMYYNDLDGTLDLILKGGNVTLQLGQETVIRVVNKTSTNISLLQGNYQAVRITGAQGQRPKVDLAQATNDVLSAETIGLVTETIDNNQEGFITTSGLVRNINTTGSIQGETWLDGDILYLSPTVAGGITKVKPIAPNHLIIIGYVIHAHVTQGSIFVKVDNGYELDELHNVKINGATNNEVLAYTLATDIWENKTLPEAGIQPTITLTTTGTSGASTLIGNTLNIPQYTGGGGSSSQSAYTILANNTNATALPTEKPFENITNDIYSGTIVWTGGAAPSGTTLHTYSLSQVGNLVTLTINLVYGAAGASTLTNVTIELPSTAPQPAAPSSVTTVGDILSFVNGNITTTKLVPAANAVSIIRLKSTSPNVFEVSISRSSAAFRYAYATIQYFV